MEDLTEDLQYSSMLGELGQITEGMPDTEMIEAQPAEKNSQALVIVKDRILDESVLSHSLKEMNTNMELILSSGERINIYDLLRIQFFIDTCIKDMKIMKKRMLNPNYKEDQVFSSYFHWYRRVIQNTRKFCRRVIRKNRNKTVAGG